MITSNDGGLYFPGDFGEAEVMLNDALLLSDYDILPGQNFTLEWKEKKSVDICEEESISVKVLVSQGNRVETIMAKFRKNQSVLEAFGIVKLRTRNEVATPKTHTLFLKKLNEVDGIYLEDLSKLLKDFHLENMVIIKFSY